MQFLDEQKILLGGEPILIEYQQQLAGFLGTWLPPCELFRSRISRPKSGKSTLGLEARAFASPWPELPPLKIGQFQVPIGFGRFSRGLFAVDKETLRRIAGDAYDDSGTPATVDDVYPLGSDAISWGGKRKPITLSYVAESSVAFEVFLLKPIRIAAHSADAWLLPVVDRRYDWQEHRAIVRAKRWHEFFQMAMEDELGIENESIVPSSLLVDGFGVPDRLCCSGTTPLVRILDAAGLSIGYRYIPGIGMQKVEDSREHRDWRLDRDSIIAGGHSGTCLPIHKVKVVFRKSIELCGDWGQRQEETSEYQKDQSFEFEHELNTEPGREVETMALWWVDHEYPYEADQVRAEYQSAAEDFLSAWAPDWEAWDLEEYIVTFAGVVPAYPESESGGSLSSSASGSSIVCGHDDFAVIEITEKTWVTRIHSLPHDFVPKYLVGQWELCQVQQGPIFVKVDECQSQSAVKNEDGTVTAGIVNCVLARLDLRTSPAKLDSEVDGGEVRLNVFNWDVNYVAGFWQAVPQGGVYCFANGNKEQIVCMLSEEPDPDGYFDGVVQVYNPETREWQDACSCKIIDMNAEQL